MTTMRPSESTAIITPPFRPKLVVDVELTAPLPTLLTRNAAGKEHDRALVIVRLHTEPVGIIDVDLSSGGCTPDQLGKAIWDTCGHAIADRMDATDGVDAMPVACPLEGLVTGPSRYLEERERVLGNAPSITVVVCTLGRRAQQLSACLARLVDLSYPSMEILVVDNAPGRGSARTVVDQLPQDLRIPVRYTEEPRLGLSWARNRGTEVADGEILACIDDDEIPDPYWLAEIARGFASEPDVSCVTGSIVPAVIDTQAQDWFEQWGGHVKGRGFERAVFDLATLGQQSPLYPLPPFGEGGNVAFRKSALLDVGGFDVALGAGTISGASEETEMFARLLLRGHRIVYQPSALVRHRNRETRAELEKQLYEYGTGLTAYFTATIMRNPLLAGRVLKLLPGGVRDLVRKDSLSRAKMKDFPDSLRGLQRRGMVAGPIAYLRSRHHQRRVSQEHAAIMKGLG